MPPRPRALEALVPDTDKLDGLATFDARERIELAHSTAATVAYKPRSAASTELVKDREAALTSASLTSSTPIKSGGATDLGIDRLTRAHVEQQLAEELDGRRSKSSDLVELIFGPLVSIDGAADILRHFLDMSIVSVQKEVDGKLMDVGKEEHKAACASAAIQAQEATKSFNHSSADPYRWKWSLPVEASEAAAALFLNVVAIAAHVATIRSGKAQDQPLPALRFITLPNPLRPVPLSNESAPQDCRPDVVALDCSAFRQAPVGLTPNLFLLDNSPFEYIRKELPTILFFSPSHRSASGPAILAFETWFKEQEASKYLDMSKFCWPELQITAEAKMSDIYHAILQEFVYMRQQRRTQPWMRSIAGLVITNKIIGVLRADTLGVEQCTFSRDCSRGALDTIRVCLGLVRSTSLERGQHEAFELANTTTIAPPHLKPAKVKTSNDVFNEDPRVEYIHRTVRFIRLRGRRLHYSEDQTKPNIITYYVHHLVQDNGSLIGRCPRIFCVSRETESTDTVRHFVGPYALKLYYADHASDCYRDDLISAARNGQVKNVLLPTWEWHYGDALSLRGLPPDVVHHYSLTHEHALHNREEIFAQSDLKRLLVQCSSYDEFAQAFINFAEAIASLTERNLAHRDLSIGNVLLSHDTPCPSTFFSEATASAAALLKARVTFTQRALEQRVGGLIHDMDMAGRLHRLPDKVTTKGRKSKLAILKAPSKPQPPVNSVAIEKGFRTGTPPFMAIGLLVDGPPHFVAYDFHSLLFVMVLFFWSYPRFKADVPFPCPVPTRTRTWPSEVLRWANRPVGFSLAELGGLKRIFFSKHEVLRQTLNRTLEGDLWTEDSAYLDLFWALYATLWSPSDETASWTDLKDVIPEEVIEALKEAFHDDGSL